MRSLGKLIRSCEAASAVEYAIILAIIGTGIALAAYQLGLSISQSFAQTTTQLESCGGNC